MEPEMKSACLKAGAKLGIGLSLLAAVIGIRLVTTQPDGVESDIRELERLDAQLASEATAANPEAPAAKSTDVDDSIVSRFSRGIHDLKSNSDSRSRAGDKLVSCSLAGRTHFMRENDCAMRGGESTILSEDR
jgi:hypothetical protein